MPNAMRRRYVKATILGIAIGLFVLPMVSFFQNYCTSWEMPLDSGVRFLYDPTRQVRALTVQALNLRFCGLFLDYGAQVFGISLLIVYLLAKFDEIGEKNETVRNISRSLHITAFSIVLYAIAVGAFSKPRSGAIPETLEQLIIKTWGESFEIIFTLICSGIGIGLWMVTYQIISYRQKLLAEEAKSAELNAVPHQQR